MCFTNFLLFIFLALVSLLVFVSVLAKPKVQQRVYQLEPTYIVNPLMGLAPWATLVDIEQPHTLVYAELTWRDFEPEEGVYDLRTFEERNQLSRWREEGKRVVFRFLLDKPSDEMHMDIPEWLFEKINAAGEFYDQGYGKGFNPDYTNQDLITYHEKAITYLGQRYGQDDFFAYIELGSLGHWGEWHVNSESGSVPLPNEQTRDLYVQHYENAFPNTHLLMRRPFNIAAESSLGLFNDMVGDYISTTTWLDWIENGGEFDQTNEMDALSPMPNGWELAPIGGEQSSLISDEVAYRQKVDQTIQLVSLSHMTFIGPGGPYDVEYGSELQSGIDAVLSEVGYRFYFDYVIMPEVIEYCDNREVTISFNNFGNAPIYYKWPLLIYIFDENQRLVDQYPIDFDLRSVLPDHQIEVTFQLPIEKLTDGLYHLGIAVIDPQTGEPAIRFAMKNSRPDLIFELGSFEINRNILTKWFSDLPGLCT